MPLNIGLYKIDPIQRIKKKLRDLEFKSTFGAPEGLKNSLVTKSVLSTLHYKSQPVVDTLMSLLLQNVNEKHYTRVQAILIKTKDIDEKEAGCTVFFPDTIVDSNRATKIRMKIRLEQERKPFKTDYNNRHNLSS